MVKHLSLFDEKTHHVPFMDRHFPHRKKVSYLNASVLGYLARRKLRSMASAPLEYIAKSARNARNNFRHGTWDILMHGYSYNGKLRVTPGEARMVFITRALLDTMNPFNNSLLMQYEKKTYKRAKEGREGDLVPYHDGMAPIRKMRLEQIAGLPGDVQRKLRGYVVAEDITTEELKTYLALKTLEGKKYKQQF